MNTETLLADIKESLEGWKERFDHLEIQIAALRNENAELKEQLLQTPPTASNQVWLEPKPAATSLGLASGRALHEWRLSGKFRPKVHFRNVAKPGSRVPRWQYHIPNCQKVLERQI